MHFAYMNQRAPLLLAVIFLLPLCAKAQVSFNFTYSDPSSLWTAEARTALETAASNVSAYLPGYTATIQMNVTASNVSNGTLASAGTNFGPLSDGFNHLGVIGTKIQTGTDRNRETTDGFLTVNFANNWSFTDLVSNTQFDFINVMMHELAHSLGFMSAINWDGSTSLGWSTSFSRFDNFLVDADGVYLVDHTAFTTGTAWQDAREDGIYFSGANAVAANGGQLVPIYSPDPWREGSSGSHLDTDTYTGTEEKLMNHATTTGLGERVFSDLEIAIFQDLGYNFVNPVPEPSSLLLIALTPGLIFRRRRLSAAE